MKVGIFLKAAEKEEKRGIMACGCNSVEEVGVLIVKKQPCSPHKRKKGAISGILYRIS